MCTRRTSKVDPFNTPWKFIQARLEQALERGELEPQIGGRVLEEMDRRRGPLPTPDKLEEDLRSAGGEKLVGELPQAFLSLRARQVVAKMIAASPFKTQKAICHRMNGKIDPALLNRFVRGHGNLTIENLELLLDTLEQRSTIRLVLARYLGHQVPEHVPMPDQGMSFLHDLRSAVRSRPENMAALAPASEVERAGLRLLEAALEEGPSPTLDTIHLSWPAAGSTGLPVSWVRVLDRLLEPGWGGPEWNLRWLVWLGFDTAPVTMPEGLTRLYTRWARHGARFQVRVAPSPGDAFFFPGILIGDGRGVLGAAILGGRPRGISDVGSDWRSNASLFAEIWEEHARALGRSGWRGEMRSHFQEALAQDEERSETTTSFTRGLPLPIAAAGTSRAQDPWLRRRAGLLLDSGRGAENWDIITTAGYVSFVRGRSPQPGDREATPAVRRDVASLLVRAMRSPRYWLLHAPSEGLDDVELALTDTRAFLTVPKGRDSSSDELMLIIEDPSIVASLKSYSELRRASARGIAEREDIRKEVQRIAI